ncbi:recombinase family protein [Streptomyces collinus]|uniref:recombinase family protein n=1 Tax=Streptomyces collinus TaxID=42684 RepID=UPI0033DF3B63
MQPTELVILYARVSHIKKGAHTMVLDTRSTDQQLDFLRNTANTQRWRVIAELVDPDRSASLFATKTRENYATMKRLVREHKPRPTLLAAWELDRFERVTSDWLELLDLCADLGVRLWYSGRIVDPRDPNDRYMATVEGAGAERTAGLISKNVRRGVAGAADEGRPHGRPPYGLKKGPPDERNRPTWVLDEEPVTPAGDTRRSVVREIITRISLGDSIERVKKDLDSRRIVRPDGTIGDWNRQTIRNIATNVVYVARAVRHVQYGQVPGERRTVTVPARWPAIIEDEEVFHAARVRLEPFTTGRPGAAKYLLTRFATCGVCGGLTRGKVDTNKRYGVRYVSYRCDGGCVSRCLAQLDQYVTVLLFFRLARPDIAELITRDDKALRTAIAQRDEAEMKIEEWRHAAELGQIGPAEYNRFTQPLSEKKIKAERAIEDAAAANSGAVLLDPQIIRTWPDLNLERRRAMIKAAFTKIVIEPQKSNRFDARNIAVQWRGSETLLRRVEIDTRTRIWAPELRVLGGIRWTAQQRERIGWDSPGLPWIPGWQSLALHLAWNEPKSASDIAHLRTLLGRGE